MKRPTGFLILIILFFQQGSLFAAAPSDAQIEARAIWVTRWDYQKRKDIQAIVNNAANHNFNIIFFQVRGAGTVYFKSELEPQAWNNSFLDPLWDPLSCAVEYAHQAGIQLHAWVNVYPGWANSTAPTDPSQLWNAHPDWFMVDNFNRRQRLNNHYVWLSPTHPEARQHLINLFLEIIKKYDVDGLHFDYIRYPGPGYSYDRTSVQLFEQTYKDKPLNLPQKWDQFRRDAITSLVDSVYRFTIRNKPNVILSCAVVRDLHIGKKLFFQDGHSWVARGIIDFIAPMNYTSDMLLFQNIVEDHLQNSLPRFVFPGIMTEDGKSVINQIEFCRQKGCAGHCLFSYNGIFSDHRPNSIARLLKASSYKNKAKIPAFKSKKKRVKRPVISKITILPERVYEDDEINVRCLVTDLPQKSRLYLKWCTNGSLNRGRKIPLTRQNGTSDYFITPYGIPPQKKENYLKFNIFFDDDVACSEIKSVLINDRHQKELFKQYIVLGPLIYDAQFVIVDSFNRAWVCERGKNKIRIINPDGSEANISPILEGKNKYGVIEKISNPCGIAIDSQGIIYVSGNPKKGSIYKYNSITGWPLNGMFLPFWPGEIDIDKNGNLFVIEANKNCWHVLDNNGQELKHSPFYGSHQSRGIAVSRDGKTVYVACQAEGTVHCWQGEIKGDEANYTKISDLPIQDVGMGTVDVDSDGNIYVSQVNAGLVTIFDKQQNLITRLKGNYPPLRAPRGAAVSNDGSILYIVEWGINSGTRLQKWVRKK